MMIAQLAVLVSANVLLKQSLKAIFMLLMVTFAPIVAHALMCALLKQFTPNNIEPGKICITRLSAGFFLFLKFLFVLNLNNSGGLNIC
jgi:hypothetical protein